MSRYSSSAQAHRQAMHTAIQEHVSLGTDLTKRIDIFRIIEQKGFSVMFQPLGSLYGVYMNIDNKNGIMINSKHPPNLQRFTAAHEYGHFVMQHGPRGDMEDQIFPAQRRYDPQEVEAQIFAAHFLMPLQLVNTRLSYMGLPLKPEIMTPGEIYHLSLELGASYIAVINHLVSLKKLNSDIAKKIRDKPPKSIKANLHRGVGPQNSWADVWRFSKRDNGRDFFVYADDEIHLYLPEGQSPKNEWILTDTIGNEHLLVVQSGLEVSLLTDEDTSQQTGFVRHFFFRTYKPGNKTLHLEMVGAEGTEVFEIHITILPRQPQGLLYM